MQTHGTRDQRPPAQIERLRARGNVDGRCLAEREMRPRSMITV
jgi:hypothetical protein